MTKTELIESLSAMSIYEKDYEVISALLGMNDDNLLVKIVEEVAEGNLLFTDFYSIFSGTKYTGILEANLESQERLRQEIERTIAFRREFGNDPDYAIDPSTTRIGVTVQDAGSPTKGFYDSSEETERNQLIYDILSPDPTDDPVVRRSKLSIYTAITQGTLSEEDVLLFARDYIVPISYENQVLNGSDISFMVENNLTEDQVRKIKALSAFLRRGSAG
jgi:hypothetical protein